MSDRQVFRGCLAFPSGALEEALDRVADDTDELVMDLLRGARVGDDLLVLSEDSFFPASLWHHWTGAVAELSAVAHAGLVAVGITTVGAAESWWTWPIRTRVRSRRS